MPQPPIPHPTLATPRLRLRPFRAGDTDAMHECYADPGAMRFWNHGPHANRHETARELRRCATATPSRHRFWAVADAASDRCLGMVNYHNANPHSRTADIGYLIHPAYHRQGIATESVAALLDFCFAVRDLRRIRAFIDPDNTASRSLAEKLGFRCQPPQRENLRVDSHWRDDMLYARLKTDHARPS
ncbi:MAG: GNAT family N-acetyltransferase [Acetobacteraceae bacterium]|nr:GNAT family N-acetyltransferase [Acetobacteraceae bacterium]